VIFARRGVAVGAKLAMIVSWSPGGVEHLVGARVLAGMPLSRAASWNRSASRRVPPSARPLGDLVDDVVDLLVLRREELVQVVELNADHVPCSCAVFV